MADRLTDKRLAAIRERVADGDSDAAMLCADMDRAVLLAEVDRLRAELAGAREEHRALAESAKAYLERIGNDEVGYMPDILSRLGSGAK